MEVEEAVALLRAAGCVYAEEEAALILGDPRPAGELIERRTAGEPLELVLGWAEFRGLRIAVAPGVFVPRRRTEYLAGLAIEHARPGAVCVDLCCGSGAIAAALLAEAPGVTVHAADVDPVAVACARRNLPPDSVHEGDLLDALPAALAGHIDVLVANTPYVPSDEIGLMPSEARDWEPLGTLDGGPDGLRLLRRIAHGARDWLTPGGVLLIEVGERQLPAALAAYESAGLVPSAAQEEGSSVAIGRPARSS